MKMSKVKKRCGHIAIIGRPNVGKSTLLNHLIQQKISITSKKPQTTRQRILGIKTVGRDQMIYVDTPGIHQAAPRALNRYMNRAATSAVFDVDLILFVVDGLHWMPDDEWVLKKIEHATVPVMLVVNKIDKISDKTSLLPHLETLSKKYKFAEVVPLIAKSNQDAQMLEKIIMSYLPQGEFIFDEDQLTDRSERFLAAEIIREKLMRQLGQELPYDLTVAIEEYKAEQQATRILLHISAVIYVEKQGQKIIVIGEKGAGLKAVGEKARLDMEKLFGNKVFLKLWVKVKRGWADDERGLQGLGFS
jgi:GTP-binding protein Era